MYSYDKTRKMKDWSCVNPTMEITEARAFYSNTRNLVCLFIDFVDPFLFKLSRKGHNGYGLL